MNLYNTKSNDLHDAFKMPGKPKRPKLFMKLFVWTLGFPRLFWRRHKLTKVNAKGLKHPYILLANHNSIIDLAAAAKAIFPYTAANVVALDGFIKHEYLVHWIGSIGKRKFTNDATIVRHILHILKHNKVSLIMYPEARYSLVGTTQQLPENIGKLIKLAKVPVVVMMNHGHHLADPFFNKRKRYNKVASTFTQIIKQEEIELLSVEEINARIKEVFVYDDYQWQKDNQIKVKDKHRAVGLDNVLYKCPHCEDETSMMSKGIHLWCDACNNHYEMTQFGELKHRENNAVFTHIPAWYEWQRDEIKEEVKHGHYRIDEEVIVDALPNSKGFIPLGTGHLIHDSTGFVLSYTLESEKHVLIKESRTQQAIHVEFDYNHQGDCISFSTHSQTFYIYFKNPKISITKIALAVEVLYDLSKIQDKEALSASKANVKESVNVNDGRG